MEGAEGMLPMRCSNETIAQRTLQRTFVFVRRATARVHWLEISCNAQKRKSARANKKPQPFSGWGFEGKSRKIILQLYLYDDVPALNQQRLNLTMPSLLAQEQHVDLDQH